MLFDFLNFIFLNLFFFNFFIFSLFILFFCNLIINGNFEFKSLYLNFILYTTEIKKDYLIIINNKFLINSLNLLFINFYDKILDFLDYFLFFFSVYFIYPELLFWYAYIINKFSIEYASWTRINYDILSNEFYSHKNHKNNYIFQQLKKRWLIDHRFFIIIYSLYFKIIVRFIYFFIYFFFLVINHYLKKFISIFYFNTYTHDFLSYIYIYFYFYLKKYINISLIRKLYIYIEYLKYEFIYFFYNLPFFFYFYNFILFLNTLFFKTFSFLNVYRFKTRTTGYSIPNNYSLSWFEKIIPIIYINKLNLFKYFSFIFLFFRYFFLIIILLLSKIINNSTFIYFVYLISLNITKNYRLIFFFIIFCYGFFYYNNYLLIIILIILLFYFLNKFFFNLNQIYFFIGCSFFLILKGFVLFLKWICNIIFYVLKKIKYILFFIFFCFFILYCDWNLISILGLNSIFEKINLILQYWVNFVTDDVYFVHFWSWSWINDYKLFFNEYVEFFILNYNPNASKQQRNLNFYYETLDFSYSLLKVFITDIIFLKVVNPNQLLINYDLLVRQTNFGIIFKIIVIYLDIIYINLQYYFFLYIMPFLFFYTSDKNVFYFFWFLWNWLNLMLISFYYYVIYLLYYWIPFNIIPYFINVYFYFYSLIYKFIIISNFFNYTLYPFIFYNWENLSFFLYNYWSNIMLFLIVSIFDMIEIDNIYNIYVICFFSVYEICLFFFYNIKDYLNISHILYIISCFYINFYIEFHEKLNLIFSWFRIPVLQWNIWNNWKELTISAIQPDIVTRTIIRDYAFYSPIFLFRGDFLILTNIEYYFFFINFLYSNFSMLDTFILIDEYFYPFYLRYIKFIIIIYYYVLLVLFNLFFKGKEEVIGNNMFLWEKIKETLTFNTINELVSTKDNNLLKKLQKKKLNKKTYFNKFYFKLFKIKLNNLTMNFNFILNNDFIGLKNNQNIYSNIKEKYLLNIKNFNNINNKITSDIIFNYFTKINQKFYNEISYYKNEYLNVYFKTYKQNFLYILNNFYLDLLVLLRIIYKTDPYILYFLAAQDSMNEYQYYFVSPYNKNIRTKLADIHKLLTFKILNYFGKIDEFFFNDKGPKWLLHKNTYTLFFHTNTAGIEVIISQNSILFTRSFFWKWMLPFFLLIFIYFQGLNYFILHSSDLKAYYLFLFMFLDNYDFFFNFNTYVIQPISFIQRGAWSECSYANRGELEEYGNLLFSSKYQNILYLFDYKNLYYFNNNWNFINVILHPFIYSCSWELSKIYKIQMVSIICILFVYLFKFYFFSYNSKFNKIDKTKVQIKNKVIIAIYKHYDFIFNKKKFIYKNNIKL